MKKKKTRNWQLFWVMVCLPMCWVFLRFSGWHWEEYPILTACFSGMAIVTSAFLLCWAAEVAQKDISQALALAFLALIAVLPEYAVDIYFAWMAGKNSEYIPYALANMTGANRLLIGFGWTLVVILYWLTKKAKEVKMEEGQKVEISYLALATLYSFIIPIKGSLSLIDAVVLLTLFVFYIISASKAHVIEPELIGPAMELGMFSDVPRRLVITALFLYSAFVILVSTEPFAEGLLMTGKMCKIDEFILVQWLAPLASETPEIAAAILFVLKAKPTMGLGILVSSKVNQWTLLIGMIPIVFCISSGKLATMIIDARQIEELFLTVAQSAFAVAILISLSISVGEALILFMLFATQLVLPAREIRLIYGFVYLILTFFIFYKDRTRLKNLFK